MRWKVASERPLYRDEWLDIRVADVELPGGRHLEHRLIRTPPGAGCVVTGEGRVLLIWRHRFITDTWGWEIPIGGIHEGEDPADAARRECEEETGWRPGRLRPLIYTQPTPGLSTSEHHIFHATEASYTGPPTENFEAERTAWIPLADLRQMITRREIVSGTTLVALLYLLLQAEGTTPGQAVTDGGPVRSRHGNECA